MATLINKESRAVGDWIKYADSWYESPARYCALTGQLLPGRIWVAEIAGQVLTFVDPASEQLYREYVLGRSGAAPPATGTGPAARQEPA